MGDDILSELDGLIQCFSPTRESEAHRRAMVNFIIDIFRKYNVGCTVAMGGSFPLRVYLPESDLDVVVLTPQNREERDSVKEIMEIFSCLCDSIRENDKTPFPIEFEEFKIQSIEFINARTRVIKCVVNKMSLDITANQRSSLASAAFLEEANRLIGHEDVYKRSVLLVKAWCLHESKRYCGVSISGSKGGMFSSYALSVLVLYLFCTYQFDGGGCDYSGATTARTGTEPVCGGGGFENNWTSTRSCKAATDDSSAAVRHLRGVHPLDVLRAFLKVFSSFQWDSCVVTLDGPVAIQTGTRSGPTPVDATCDPTATTALAEGSARAPATSQTGPVGAALSLGQLLHHVAERVQGAMMPHRTEMDVLAAAAGGTPNRFPLRCCNISDPVDAMNNLGIPVSWRNLKTIKTALDGGSQHLEAMLSHYFTIKQQQSNCSGVASSPVCLSPAGEGPNGVTGQPSTSSTTTTSSYHYAPAVLVAPHAGIAPGLTLPPRLPSHLSPSPAGQPPPPPGPPPTQHTMIPIAPAIFSSTSAAFPTGASSQHSTGGITSTVPALIGDQRHIPSQSHSQSHPAGRNSTCQSYLTSYASMASSLPTATSAADRPLTNTAMFVRTFFASCFAAYHPDAVPHLSLQVQHEPQIRRGSTTRNPFPSLDCGDTSLGVTPASCRQRSDSYSTMTTASSNSSSNWSSPNSDCDGPLSLEGDIESMWRALLCSTIKPDVDLHESAPVILPARLAPSPCKGTQQQLSQMQKQKAVPSALCLPHCDGMLLDVDCVNDAATDPEHHSPCGSHSSRSVNPADKSDGENDLVLGEDSVIPLSYDAKGTAKCATAVVEAQAVGVGPDWATKCAGSCPQQGTEDSSPWLVKQRRSQHAGGSNGGGSMVSSKGSKKRKGGKGPRQERLVRQQQQLEDEQIELRRVEVGNSSTTKCEEYGGPGHNSSSDDDIAITKARHSSVFTTKTSDTFSRHEFLIALAISSSAIAFVAFCIASYLHALPPTPSDTLSHIIAGSRWLQPNASLVLSSRRAFDVSVVPAKVTSGKSDLTPYDSLLSAFDGDAARMESSMQLTDVWLRAGDNVTLGLSHVSQDMYYYYMNNDTSVRELDMIGEPLSALWLKNGQALTNTDDRMACLSDSYLPLNRVDAATSPGLYTFVVVKRHRSVSGLLDNAQESGCATPAAEDIVRVLARSSVQIGVAPSSRTKGKHIILTPGASMYLHVQVDGAPTPSVQWLKNGIPVPNERKSNLIVNNVDKSHEGTYSCRLENMAGVYTWLEATVVVRSQ